MKVFIRKAADVVQVRIRAEGENVLGDMIEDIKPGDTFLGKPFVWWNTLRDGPHDLPSPPSA